MRAPWHLWVVGTVTLAWNGMAAADYAMTQYAYEPYMSQFTPAQLAYFNSFPTWVQATWALAVWLSVAGSLLLLARSRFASNAFGLALIFMAATFLHNFVLADVKMYDVVGREAAFFTARIVAVAVALWNYARAMDRSGVLR